MRMNTIYIAQIIGSDLMSRLLAKDLYSYFLNLTPRVRVIDFTGVNFATRSFMDEFYVLFKSHIQNSEIELANLPSDIEKTLEAVKSTQNIKKVISDDIIIKTKDIQDLEDHLARLSI